MPDLPRTYRRACRFAERGPLVDTFCSVYETRVLEAQGPLGAAWDPSNYRKNARNTFRMEWRWLTMDVPGRLKEISAAVFEQEREKAAAMWADALDTVVRPSSIAIATRRRRIFGRPGSDRRT